LAEWVRVREVGQSYKLLKKIKFIRVGFINKLCPRHIEHSRTFDFIEGFGTLPRIKMRQSW